MAVALPLLAVAGGAVGAAGAVGAIAAGAITAATVATAVASVASIVSGVAAMAGKSKIAKIAGIVALGGAAFGLAAGAFNGAGAGTSAELAGPPVEAAGSIESNLAGQTGNTAIADQAATIDPAKVMAGEPGTTVQGAPTPVEGAANAPSLMDRASAPIVDTGTQNVAQVSPFVQQSSAPTTSPFTDASGVSTQVGPMGNTVGQTTRIIEPFSNPVQASFLDSLKKVGTVLKDNKELVDIGGGMLKGAFGPEKQKLSLYQRQLDMEQQQIDRQNANANNLVGLRNPLVFNVNAPPVRRS